ncbi:dihydropteroate synthase [Chelativorans sp. AA-79]|uniref:dihydropteroate synthase n=1 Tax=Chelativorans sp. AA-79 TaxID=3028735 RepID=UPI0023F7D738|nr:dihydropteroate synthase [Chelativorans sp. AA-79]WEX07424.1 dihydropteroate synthase [Chelativorans sp. AA-79]
MIEPRQWNLAHGRTLHLGAEALIMGILNVTPDSFSDGGRFPSVQSAVAAARALAAQGAAIVDVGGESTRPGARPVSPAEEQRRVLPVIEALAGEPDIVISIDTYRSETARLAIEAGAHIVNDVFGVQKDPTVAAVAAETGAGLVLMHTGRERQKLPDVIADEFLFLRRSIEIAREAGNEDGQLVLDPGFGFAKEWQEDAEIMARFGELMGLGFPLLVGTSRKRFIGRITGREIGERDIATAATSALLRIKGASIFRVHDIAANRDALRIADAMLAAEK